MPMLRWASQTGEGMRVAKPGSWHWVQWWQLVATAVNLAEAGPLPLSCARGSMRILGGCTQLQVYRECSRRFDGSARVASSLQPAPAQREASL